MKTFTLFLLLFSIDACAITASEFVERLQNIHPFFTQLKLSAQIKAIDEQATHANEDWILGVNANYVNQDLSDVSVSSTPYELNVKSINVSANKKLPNSGSNIALKHTWTEKNKDIDSTHNKFSVDYVYPLLKNKNGINDRLAGDLARINVQISALDLAEQQEAFIQGKLNQLIDLAYAQQQQKINTQRLDLSAKELKLVKEKFDASVVDKVDVLLQEDAYQSAKQQQLQAQQELDLLRTELATVLHIEVENTVAELNLYQKYSAFDGDLKTYLLNRSRILKMFELTRNLLKRQLKSDKNQATAKLDLTLGVSSEGENSNYSDAISNQSPSWHIGLGLSYPIGQTLSRASIDRTDAKIADIEAQTQEKTLALLALSTVLQQKLKSLAQMLDNARLQIKIAKARTVEEKLRYNNSNSQVSFVISAQNNEQNAQLNYAQIARNYQKARVDFRAATDQLTQ